MGTVVVLLGVGVALSVVAAAVDLIGWRGLIAAAVFGGVAGCASPDYLYAWHQCGRGALLDESARVCAELTREVRDAR